MRGSENVLDGALIRKAVLNDPKAVPMSSLPRSEFESKLSWL